MEWDDWQLFLRVTEAKSLTAAARQLGVDQSTVSRRLSALEERLGAELFVRSRRGIEPTDAVARALPALRRAEIALREAEREAAGAEDRVQGVVRVSSLTLVAHYMLAPALPALLDAHPALRVELIGEAAMADLERRESDIGVRLARPRGGELVAVAIDSGPLTAFVGRDAPVPEGPLEGSELRWVTWDHGGPRTPDRAWLEGRGASIVLRATSPTLLVEAAAAGVGAVLIPAQLGLRIPGLRPVRVHGLPAGSTKLWLVVARALRRQPAVDAVWRWLRAVFSPENRR